MFPLIHNKLISNQITHSKNYILPKLILSKNDTCSEMLNKNIDNTDKMTDNVNQIHYSKFSTLNSYEDSQNSKINFPEEFKDMIKSIPKQTKKPLFVLNTYKFKKFNSEYHDTFLKKNEKCFKILEDKFK